MKATFIKVQAGVRYWEDARINGIEDVEGDLVPLREGDCWCPTIMLSDGIIMDWPEGVVADIHYKVCDAGNYWLLDENKEIVAHIDGYVPNSYLCHGSNGYGDYIIMKVRGDGSIVDYTEPVFGEKDDWDVVQDDWDVVQKKVSFEKAAFIKVQAGVRYWEDATINGVEDTDGKLCPLREGDYWCPVINLKNGTVENWPKGTAANIHFKVCDDGQYWLLDGEKNIIAKWGGYYVPDDFLVQGDDTGYGDYVIMKINENGKIASYREPEIIQENWVDANSY